MSQKKSSPPKGGPRTVEAGYHSPPSWVFPLLSLVAGGIVWLVISSGFGMVASIKFHSAGFLADFEWLTYGRVRAAGSTAFIYGFCIPAATAFALCQFASLSRSRLPLPGLVLIGTVFWNLGVLVGVGGILGGDLSGFDHLELPGYSLPILLTGFLALGVWGCLALHQRENSGLEIEHWFSLAALFWFAWILTTATLLLHTFPLRGVAQSIVSWWFTGNLTVVWMGLAGLGAVLSLVRKSTTVVNRNLGLFIFWTLLLFGSWVGIPAAAPVPAWMPVLSKVFTALLLVPVLGVFVLLARSRFRFIDGQGSGFAKFSAVMFVVFGLILSISAFFGFEKLTQFTWFNIALEQLGSYGFFGFALFAVIYSEVPHFSGFAWPFPKLIKAHLALGAIGLILAVLPLMAAGLVQGLDMSNPTVTMVDVARNTLKFLRPATLGELFIGIGHLLFLVNISFLVANFARRKATVLMARLHFPGAAEVQS